MGSDAGVYVAIYIYFLRFISKGIAWNPKEITAWKVSKYGVFLVRIFPYLEWMNKEIYPVNLHARNYEPEKLRIWTIFTQWIFVILTFEMTMMI